MRSYKEYVGPRQMARKRRRRQGAVAIVAVAVMMALSSAPMPARQYKQPDTSSPSQMKPTKGSLVYARNYYAMNGPNGEALVYLNRRPEFEAYISGEKNIEDLTELPDGTVVP